MANAGDLGGSFASTADFEGTYQLHVTSNSMEPEFRQGDIVLVHPRLPPKAGLSHVFYQDAPDQMIAIRHLEHETADEWHVRQWNPRPGEPAEARFSKKRWPKCHRILGTYPSQTTRSKHV